MTSYATEIPEAFADTDLQAAAPMAPELRAVVPAPADPELEELEQLSSRHRVLLIRTGAVIAVTTLISVGGALLFHALLAGVVVLGLWFPWAVPGIQRGQQLRVGIPDVGGSAGGFTILGDGPDDNAPPAPRAPDILGMPMAGLANALPQLPELNTAPAAASLAAPMLPPLSPAQDLDNIRVKPPQMAAPEPPTPTALVVAPPGDPLANSNTSVRPGLPARGTGAGDGGGEEDRIVSLVKGDGEPGSGGGGIGSGRGKGRGNGIDRGLSVGDRPAQELNQVSTSARLELPPKYQVHPPEKDVILAIAVAADGTVTSVRVEESCGFSDVDELVRGFVQATYRSSPEYRAGKAIDSVQYLHYTFHPL